MKNAQNDWQEPVEAYSLRLWELKVEGHRILDELEELGCDPNGNRGSYARVSALTRLPRSQCHFTSARTVEHAEKLVEAFKSVHASYSRMNPKRKAVHIPNEECGKDTMELLPNVTLSLTDQKVAFEKLRLEREVKLVLPWWEKVIHTLLNASRGLQ